MREDVLACLCMLMLACCVCLLSWCASACVCMVCVCARETIRLCKKNYNLIIMSEIVFATIHCDKTGY